MFTTQIKSEAYAKPLSQDIKVNFYWIEAKTPGYQHVVTPTDLSNYSHFTVSQYQNKNQPYFLFLVYRGRVSQKKYPQCQFKQNGDIFMGHPVEI